MPVFEFFLKCRFPVPLRVDDTLQKCFLLYYIIVSSLFFGWVIKVNYLDQFSCWNVNTLYFWVQECLKFVLYFLNYLIFLDLRICSWYVDHIFFISNRVRDLASRDNVMNVTTLFYRRFVAALYIHQSCICFFKLYFYLWYCYFHIVGYFTK